MEFGSSQQRATVLLGSGALQALSQCCILDVPEACAIVGAETLV